MSQVILDSKDRLTGLKEALKRGFVTKITENKFLVNNEYDNQKGESSETKINN